MSKPMDTNVEFTCGLAIRGDRLYVAASPDSMPAHSEFTRLYHYDAHGARPWTKHDVPWWTVALEKHRERPDAALALCALSEEGDMELVAEGRAVVERIPDAGLRGPTSKGYGYVASVRSIGSHLYVCGGAGQVYKRLGPDQWEHMDEGLLQARDVADRLLLRAIDGPAEDDIYVGGDLPGPAGLEGRLFHWDGSRWRAIDLPPLGGLNAIYIENEERVWIAGLEGALLVGHHRKGFTNLTSKGTAHLFHDLTVYDGTLYLGSNYGLFKYDERRRRVFRVTTTLSPDLAYVSTVDHADGVLWCVGPKDIACFDGNTWTRIDHPDNPKRR